MKILIPAIKALCIKHHGGIKISMHFPPFYVRVEATPPKPKDVDGEYKIRVGIRNSLLEKSEIVSVKKFCNDEYVVLDDLREKILATLEEAFSDKGKGMTSEELAEWEKYFKNKN